MTNSRLPTYYIPHGGGPCFFVKPEHQPAALPPGLWDPMATYLKSIGPQVGRKPRAVIVASSHWITPHVTVGTAATHHLLYDYWGFPPYTYAFDYAPAGAPEVAARAVELLAAAGIHAETDDRRGIDHGVFVPFMLIYPDGDVPIVPMSLREGLDPAAHLEIGRALAPLRDEDVLIVGSGMSFHNFQAFRSNFTAPLHAASAAFDDWLAEAAAAASPAREHMLAAWSEAPGARAAQPLGAEEHLLPLMIASGAAGDDPGRQTYDAGLGGYALSGFTFG